MSPKMSGDQKLLHDKLLDFDPILYDLMYEEQRRQYISLEMIASENFTSCSVMECLGSFLTNKYSEGYPGVRYYGGNTFIDQIETLAQKRSLKAFGLDPNKWGVNVQPYSGSPANFAVYAAVVEPHGRIMGLDLPDGGHLTHGFMTSTKRISATSIFFESMPYKVDPKTGLIDYDKLAESARLFKPKLIIAGISCYSRCLNYKRFREIADENGAILFGDMSHVGGLVAAGVIPSPFEYCDIVTTTTHKTMRGPRAGVIFFRKGVNKIVNGREVLFDYEERINMAVFPGLQGGPHNNQIAGIALAMKQARTKEFHQYQEQVVKNAKALCKYLQKFEYKIVTGGTDTHLLLIDLRPQEVTGAQAEYILDKMNFACNKNTAPGDKSALNPSGVRLGTPALTSRGMKEDDMEIVAEFFHKALLLSTAAKDCAPENTLASFKYFADTELREKIADQRKKIEKFASKFPIPGYNEFDDSDDSD